MYRKSMLACYLSALFITGCGGSGGGGSTTPVTATPTTPVTPAASVGVFLDSAVAGLHYETETQTGVSNSAGEFNYVPGEIITFSIGDVVIGSALAAPVMTPLSLVPGAIDETHPVVINIVRLLLTLDTDGDPNNGIDISTLANDAAVGKIIDFEAVDFEAESGLIDLLRDFNGTPRLVGRDLAQQHFNGTLSEQSSWGKLTWGTGIWKKSTP